MKKSIIFFGFLSILFIFSSCGLFYPVGVKYEESFTSDVVGYGSADRISIKTDEFPANGISRYADIWLPEGYSQDASNGIKYSVLYMFDGQGLFGGSEGWRVDENYKLLKENKSIEKTIVVGFHSGEFYRYEEYFPKAVYDKITGDYKKSIDAQFTHGCQSDVYLDVLVNTLRPYVNSNYSVYTDSAHTFISGSSMGGLMSMYALCKYPDVFGAAACLSTHWIGAYPEHATYLGPLFVSYAKTNIPQATKGKRFYFDHGDTGSWESLYYTYQEQVDSYMLSAGYTKSTLANTSSYYSNTNNFASDVYPGHEHNETYWGSRFSKALSFLIAK